MCTCYIGFDGKNCENGEAYYSFFLAKLASVRHYYSLYVSLIYTFNSIITYPEICKGLMVIRYRLSLSLIMLFATVQLKNIVTTNGATEKGEDRERNHALKFYLIKKVSLSDTEKKFRDGIYSRETFYAGYMRNVIVILFLL